MDLFVVSQFLLAYGKISLVFDCVFYKLSQPLHHVIELGREQRHFVRAADGGMCLIEFSLLNKIHGGDQLTNWRVNIDQEKCCNGQDQDDQHDTGGNHGCVSPAVLHV